MPARSTDIFRTSVTFDMPGATWEYVNALHTLYRFHERWPAGMLCHIMGESEAGILSIGLWRNRDVEQEYFRRVALKVITESINTIGPPPTTDKDIGPREQTLSNLVLTELCDGFADIGEDEDGSAIHVLGSEPVLATYKPGTPHRRPIDQLNEDGGVPLGLIIGETTDANGTREHQVWSSEELALQSVTDEEFTPDIIQVKRISFGSAELHA